MPYTTSTPVPLFWTKSGPDHGEQLLVLHGGPGAHHDYLLPQMLELARTRGCLFYDQRGGGQSKHDDDRETITWEMQVADCARVAREFSLEPLTLVGYSWGALLALLYTVQAVHGHTAPAPERLVLIDPAPVSRTWRGEFEAEFALRQASPEVATLRAELAASGLKESDPAAFRQRSFELSVAGYFSHPANAHSLTPFRVTGRVQQSIWESLGDFDLIPALQGVRIPTLVLHGRQDPIPLASSAAVADAMGAEFVILDDCGHVPYVEQPAATFAAIGSFLDRHPSRPTA